MSASSSEIDKCCYYSHDSAIDFLLLNLLSRITWLTSYTLAVSVIDKSSLFDRISIVIWNLFIILSHFLTFTIRHVWIAKVKIWFDDLIDSFRDSIVFMLDYSNLIINFLISNKYNYILIFIDKFIKIYYFISCIKFIISS